LNVPQLKKGHANERGIVHPHALVYFGIGKTTIR
jgi:hypothetical protein